MGMEAFLVATAEQPDTVARLLHRIADYQIALVRRLIAHGGRRHPGDGRLRRTE